MVYNGISSGLNKVQWAPHFMSPTMSINIRATKIGTNMGDIDIGEMILNFIMHKSIRKSFRLDVTHIRPYDPKLEGWE